MDKNIKFDDFNKAVVNSIREYLPITFANADVSLSVVNKNNGLILTGLIVRNINSTVTPTIYLNDFYEKYQDGMEFETVLKKIAELRVNHEYTDEFDVEYISEFSRCKGKIVPRLINAEANQNMLLERPYKEILDLAVTYHILLDEEGSMSVPITNSLAEKWGVTAEELYEISISNMSTVNPSSFRGINEVMAEMTGMSVEELELLGEEKMFVLSNRNKSFGAVALLDKEMMKHITDRFGSVYVLPSSVHEFLIIMIDENMNVSDLRAMVHEVNDQVSLEERLSENVYILTIEKGLCIA